MTKTSIKHLEWLKNHVVHGFMYEHYGDFKVTDIVYINTEKELKEKAEKIIRLYTKGMIIEAEAVDLLCGLRCGK